MMIVEFTVMRVILRVEQILSMMTIILNTIVSILLIFTILANFIILAILTILII